MALLPTQQVAITGTTVTFQAAAGGGDTLTPDDRTCLELKNASGGNITATIAVPGSFYGQPLADVAIVVPLTSGHVRIGPLGPALADPTTGLITVTYSGVTSLTAAAVRT